MQTFLPYPDFRKSALCLDNKRLGNQRNEAFTLLQTVLGLSSGWRYHPATKMWQWHAKSLAIYGMIVCGVWQERGFKDTVGGKINALSLETWRWSCRSLVYVPPPWIGDSRLHSSHRANLLRKNLEWYSQFDWTEKPRKGYFWPSSLYPMA